VARSTAGFVPIENGIEGTVSATIDGLIHDVELHIRARWSRISTCNLMACLAPASRRSTGVVLSPCAGPVSEVPGPHPPEAEQKRVANSTADAPGFSEESDAIGEAAIRRGWPPRGTPGDLAEDVEDHRSTPDQVRPRGQDPRPGAHGARQDEHRLFQRADHPGSLHGILGQFAARNINLSKLESRPTKQALGDYCFVIDLSGHVGDEVVAELSPGASMPAWPG